MEDDITLEKVVPHSIEAERSVLGAILVENKAFNEAAEMLQENDFYRESHRKIFAKMEALWEQSKAIDPLTLSEELKKSGDLESIGGTAYLASLIDGVPKTTNIEYYVRIVKEKSVLRQLIFASNEIISRCYTQNEDTDVIINDAERSIFAIAEEKVTGGFISFKEIAKDTIKNIDKLYERKELITGLPTPFIEFNELTGGLQPGDYIVVASRPAMGKTSLSLNIAQHVGLKTDETVGIFSLEMSKEQLVIRMLCSRAEVDSRKLRSGFLKDAEWHKLYEAMGVLSNAKIFVDDMPSISVVEMRAKARKLKQEHGLGLLIVDYMQLMTMPQRFENRNQEISAISRALKGLAKELNIPLIALSQLSRAPEVRADRRPQLSDLRESGAIEQDADLVCFIFREEEYNPTPENEGLAEFIIAKHRNGPTATIRLAFQKKYTRFFDLAKSGYIEPEEF
jgi:replicative DNA helicase